MLIISSREVQLGQVLPAFKKQIYLASGSPDERPTYLRDAVDEEFSGELAPMLAKPLAPNVQTFLHLMSFISLPDQG